MNCYNHHSTAAIGVCRACGKAVCAECLVEQHIGISCKGACEEYTRLQNEIISNYAKVLSVNRYQLKSSGIMTLLFGIGFLIFSLWAYEEAMSFLSYFCAFMGIVLFIAGILRLIRNGNETIVRK
jgi:hypothetical protein